MNSTQIQTTLAPLLTFLAGLAAGKGLFGWDAQTWLTVLGAIVGFGATIWAAVATKSSTIAATTQNMTGVTVQTTAAAAPAVAAAVEAAKAG
jgi:hypothetical protein